MDVALYTVVNQDRYNITIYVTVHEKIDHNAGYFYFNVSLPHSQQDAAALHGHGWGGAWYISKKMITKLHRSTACIQRKGGGREGTHTQIHKHSCTV